MGLKKAILHGKEKREPYRGCKAVDASCRNRGDCARCMSDRMHSSRKRSAAQCIRVKEYTSWGTVQMEDT